jgi:hypothetical protein
MVWIEVGDVALQPGDLSGAVDQVPVDALAGGVASMRTNRSFFITVHDGGGVRWSV